MRKILFVKFTKGKLFPVLLIVLSFAYSFNRDLKIERQYTGDLRNRVVGARMQMDGKSPYFYKWKQQDGMRYFDFGSFPDINISAVTSTPFYHQLLYPIASFRQREISRIWLAAEYLMLITCVSFGFLFSGNQMQYWAVALFSAFIPYTAGWLDHIVNGQNYVVIPFLMILFFYTCRKAKPLFLFLIAGMFAISLILIKPNALVFFLPFLTMVKRYSLKKIIVFFLPAIILVTYSATNSLVRSYWKDFFVAMNQHSWVHEHGFSNNANPEGFIIDNLEGFKKSEVEIAKSEYKVRYNRETFGVATIYFRLHQMLPLSLLNLLAPVFIAGLLLLFFLRRNISSDYSLLELTLWGCCLYMVSDLFAPIVRREYNSVQWIAPILLLAASYKKELRIFFAFIAIGMILQATNFSFLRTQHSVGELVLLGTLIIMLYGRQLSTKNLAAI